MQKHVLIAAAVLAVATLGAGCKDDDHPHNPDGSHPAPATPATTQAAGAGSSVATDHPNRIRLGEVTVGALKLVATQDEPIKPGSDGPFDVVITGGKPKAVRFWVGTETAEESVKAKAEEETTDNWHTHAEVPDPLPAGSKFWVEVEPPSGEKFTRSFDLKLQ
jgi:hypothetical protein